VGISTAPVNSQFSSVADRVYVLPYLSATVCQILHRLCKALAVDVPEDDVTGLLVHRLCRKKPPQSLRSPSHEDGLPGDSFHLASGFAFGAIHGNTKCSSTNHNPEPGERRHSSTRSGYEVTPTERDTQNFEAQLLQLLSTLKSFYTFEQDCWLNPFSSSCCCSGGASGPSGAEGAQRSAVPRTWLRVDGLWGFDGV